MAFYFAKEGARQRLRDAKDDERTNALGEIAGAYVSMAAAGRADPICSWARGQALLDVFEAQLERGLRDPKGGEAVLETLAGIGEKDPAFASAQLVFARALVALAGVLGPESGPPSLERAKEHLRKLLELDPSHPEARRLLEQVDRGRHP